MVALCVTTREDAALRQLAWDLPWLACNAALEIDDISQGRVSSREALGDLVRVLRAQIERVRRSASAGLPDPTAVTVMHHAIGDAGISAGGVATVPRLLDEAGRICSRLSALADQGGNGPCEDPDGLQQMKTFCLALAEHTSVQQTALLDTEPSHPFRR